MQVIHFVHFICFSFTSFALTVLYVFMLQYLALNEQAFCFSVVSSFVLCWSDIQMFLHTGGTVHLSAPSHCKLSWGLQNVMPRSPSACLQQVRWWVGSECFCEEPLVLLHYIIASESPTLLLLNISEQCMQQRLNIRSRQQDLSSCSQNY